MLTKHRFAVLLLIVGLVGSTGNLQAQGITVSDPLAVQANPGDLDPAFGGFSSDGKIGNAPIDIYAMALQADDKIVVAGIKNNTFALARYLTNGTLDTSFGSNGVVTTIIHSTQSAAGAFAVAIQANGKIVAAGDVSLPTNDNFALARYNTDGSLDTSFSGDGKAQSDFDSGDDAAYAVAIQGDGRIVVAGKAAVSGDADFGVERFNPDGTLDSSFSGNGKVNIAFGDSDSASAMAIQSDGKLIVAGDHLDCGFISCDTDFALARLNTDGSLDPTFDWDGKLTTGFGDWDTAHGVAVQPDGKIVAAGYKSGVGFALARYLSNGSLDATFDGDGKLTTAITNAPYSWANDVVIQPDGKIVAAGLGNNQFAILRYRSDGLLDTSFAGDGEQFADFGANVQFAEALALQPDGRLIAVGQKYLVRYFPDGSLDAGGRQLVAFGTPVAAEAAYALAMQMDGKIVTAGYKAESTDQFALARLKPDGTLDPTFDGDGLLTFGFGGDERAQSVAVGSDGNIVAAGYVTSPGSGKNFMIARFGPDGVFKCFNVTDFQDGDDQPYGVAIQPDQKIIVAGSVWNPTSASFHMGIARYNANCTLDTSFGAGGKTQPGSRPGYDIARALIVQPDGKIVMAGMDNNDLALVRLTDSGALDLSFGSGGRVVQDLGGDEAAYALTRLANGQLIVAGETSADFLLARYNSSGSLDTTFGTDGVSTLDFGGVVDAAYAVAIRADGTIAAAGCGATLLGVPFQFEVAQFRPDGTPDTAFSGDGKVVTSFGDTGKCARGVGFTPDNRIIAGGYAEANSDLNFALAQYLTTAPAGGLYRAYLPAVVR